MSGRYGGRWIHNRRWVPGALMRRRYLVRCGGRLGNVRLDAVVDTQTRPRIALFYLRFGLGLMSVRYLLGRIPIFFGRSWRRLIGKQGRLNGLVQGEPARLHIRSNTKRLTGKTAEKI